MASIVIKHSFVFRSMRGALRLRFNFCDRFETKPGKSIADGGWASVSFSQFSSWDDSPVAVTKTRAP